MDRRERRRDREWAREGVWDEDEELIDRPPLPERLGKKVKRASREIGEDLSDEVERLGGRLRGWSEDVGRKAERLTEGLGDGIERAGRSSRRWLSDDESDERPRRWRKQKERQRLDEIDDEVRLRPEKAKERIRPRLAEEEEVEEEVEEEEGNGRRGWSWFGWGGWRRPDREEEEVPEGRIADVKFNSDVDVVCIDSSIASEQAFRYALRNIPRGHTLLLVHGIFTPPGAIDSKLEDEKEMLRVKGKFLNLCRRNGRRCAYREFEFTTNNELGEKVCRIADRQHAGSVILGKRAEASELRRAVLGSPSLSVMQECDVPVTLIAERKEGSLD